MSTSSNRMPGNTPPPLRRGSPLARLLAAFALPALLAGCDEATGARSDWQLRVATKEQHVLPGRPLPTLVGFRVVDDGGAPVAGAMVSFSTSSGADVEPRSAATAEDGYTYVRFTPGATPGRYTLQGRIQGRDAEASYTAHASMVSLPDTVVLAVPSCSKTVWALTVDDPQNSVNDQLAVALSVTDPSIVRATVPAYRGTPLPRYRHLEPLAPGVTRLIAQYKGWADTAVVRVYDSRALTPLRLSAYPRPLNVPVVEASRPPTKLLTGVFGEGDCPIQGEATVTIADTSIARIESRRAGETDIRAKTAGDTRIDVRYAGLSESIPLAARRMRVSPADTTIRVGESFSYRFFVAGANGVFSEVPVTSVHSFGAAASRSAITHVVTGREPGVSNMIVWSDAWETGAVVRVVSP